MNAGIVRRIIIGLMIFSLIFLVSAPSLADVIELPLDQKAGGQPWLEENWTLIPGDSALTDERVLAFGTAQPKVLKYDPDTMTVSVDAADAVTAGDTRPVTSAAVQVEIGNIEVLLHTI